VVPETAEQFGVSFGYSSATSMGRYSEGILRSVLARKLRISLASFVFEDPILPRALYDRQRATNSANDSLPNIPEKEFSFKHGVQS
jgi:hypothetical protein